MELLPAKKLNFTSDSSKLVIATCHGLIQVSGKINCDILRPLLYFTNFLQSVVI